jgi:hypothetical protein
VSTGGKFATSAAKTGLSVGQRSQVLDFLCSNEPELRQSELVQLRASGTGEWLANLPQWDEFLSPDGHNVLWCSGKPGSGKSMLMWVCSSIALSKLLTSRRSAAIERLRSTINGMPNQAVVYYYFDSTTRSSIRGAMASLLRQLCYYAVRLPPNLARSWESKGSSTQNESTVLPQRQARLDLRDITTDLLSLLPRFERVFICIDGLDECDDAEELVSILQKLVSSPCQLLVVSRPFHEFETALDNALRVRVEEFSRDDIRTFVQSFRQRYPDLSDIMDSSTMSMVTEKLTCGAEGRSVIPCRIVETSYLKVSYLTNW